MTITALSINKTGDLVEEVAIRLPEVRGHIILIAKASDGEIYIAGKNMYKLVSIENVPAALIYFVDIVRDNNSIQINDISLNLSDKVLSIGISNTNTSTNNETDAGNASAISASLQVTIPKALLGSISGGTSEN
jgi:hypothetical protein